MLRGQQEGDPEFQEAGLDILGFKSVIYRFSKFQARRHSDKEEGMGVRGIQRKKVDAGNHAVGLRYHLCG